MVWVGVWVGRTDVLSERIGWVAYVLVGRMRWLGVWAGVCVGWAYVLGGRMFSLGTCVGRAYVLGGRMGWIGDSRVQEWHHMN